MKRSIWGLLAGLCALVSLAVMWPGRGGDFIFDDVPNIVDNRYLQLSDLSWDSLKRSSLSYAPGHGSRPLAMLSFALDYWRGGGLNPGVFKETSLFIHGLTVLALAFMLRLLLTMAHWSPRRAGWMALAVAMAWAVHPLQVSSALYVVQRMQTLGTLFLVLALWAYLCARQAGIAGQASTKYWGLFALSALLGLACKEDVILLPGFTWILELTVLGFRAASPQQSARWRRGYQLLIGLGAAFFLLGVLPHYWSSDPYAWRGFNSMERLLTQGRVLVMYLGQMLLPLPQYLPFYYDDLLPSRGLLNPATTLASLVLLAGILAWAWHWRVRQPVFAAGVMLFFMGHFITSNVLNLELVFEHRNHFPLIGILMALGALAGMAADRVRISRGAAGLLGGAVLLTLCLLTFIRASIWGSPLQFAMQGADWAPNSPRALQLLCKTYYNRSGGDPDHPFFSFAIQTCEKAAYLPNEFVALSDLITLKTIKGEDATADWQALRERLQHAIISPESRDLPWLMVNNINKGVPLDSRQMVKTIMAYAERVQLAPAEAANLADYVLYQSQEPARAYALYEKAIRQSPQGDPIVQQILRDLTEHGMEEWANRLQKDRR